MREKVILVCSECLSRNYSTTISKKSKPREFKKFCKNCGKVTVHKVSK